MLLDLLQGEISGVEFAVFVVVIVVSLTVHEFAHAFAADRAGDSTPRQNKRLTLNPTYHLDVVGTVLIFLGGFGWGKPVLVNPSNFRHPRRDEILVSAAGPVSNLILATLAAGVFHLLWWRGVYLAGSGAAEAGERMLRWFILMNLGLAFFNLIPVFPLDGSHILREVLPDRMAEAYRTSLGGPAGIFILFALVSLGVVGHIIETPMMFSLKMLRVMPLFS